MIGMKEENLEFKVLSHSCILRAMAFITLLDIVEVNMEYYSLQIKSLMFEGTSLIIRFFTMKLIQKSYKKLSLVLQAMLMRSFSLILIFISFRFLSSIFFKSTFASCLDFIIFHLTYLPSNLSLMLLLFLYTFYVNITRFKI